MCSILVLATTKRRDSADTKKIRLIMKAISKENKARSGIKESKATQMNILTSKSKFKLYLHYILFSRDREKVEYYFYVIFLAQYFRVIFT